MPARDPAQLCTLCTYHACTFDDDGTFGHVHRWQSSTSVCAGGETHEHMYLQCSSAIDDALASHASAEAPARFRSALVSCSALRSHASEQLEDPIPFRLLDRDESAKSLSPNAAPPAQVARWPLRRAPRKACHATLGTAAIASCWHRTCESNDNRNQDKLGKDHLKEDCLCRCLDGFSGASNAAPQGKVWPVSQSQPRKCIKPATILNYKATRFTAR